MLTPTSEIMQRAVREGRGVPAFNVLHLETAEALTVAAERTGTPLVMQISENCVRYHGALAPLAEACFAIARDAAVPIAVHLDHAEDSRLVREAYALGFGSVMVDRAALPYAANVSETERLTREGHDRGIYVEAELGEVGGKDGAHAPGVRTDPGEARAFQEATGVDALAVAVGSSHAMLERSATLDLQLIERLRDAVPVPLVLHGSSGVPDDALRAAIAAGMVKINVSTQLNKAFTAAVRERLGSDGQLVDSRKYLAAGREALQTEAERLIGVIAGNA